MSIMGRVNRMSILIKGLKKPVTCDDCIVPMSKCDFLMKRSDECPLIELPEKHGRLIDENEVRTVMNWLLTQSQRPTWNDTFHAIQEMNPMIEAEGDEE